VAVGARQLSNAQELISAGQLKALAIFDAERNPRLPDVPTMRELGYDVVLNLARGWFGAPDIKPQEVAWYADLFKKLSEAPRWIDYVSKSGSENKYLGPVEWSEFIRDTMTTIDRIYRKMGLIK
jgi:putative tricarboxylic transport membrane protein